MLEIARILVAGSPLQQLAWLTLCALIVYTLQRIMGTGRGKSRNPPVETGWVPWLGVGVAFGKNPVCVCGSLMCVCVCARACANVCDVSQTPRHNRAGHLFEIAFEDTEAFSRYHLPLVHLLHRVTKHMAPSLHIFAAAQILPQRDAHFIVLAVHCRPQHDVLD